MDAARLSISLNTQRTVNTASLLMTKKVMNIQKQQGQQMIQDLNRATPPAPQGTIIDIRA